jgi:hypothetical protein
VLAARQYGVVTAAQLAGLGIRRGAVRRRVAAGRLHPLQRGVFAVGHRAVGVNGRRLAAVLAAGPGALLSHRSAADAWGLRRFAGRRIDVLVLNGRHPALAGARLHQTRTVHAEDIAQLGGIPITSVSRTIVDFAAGATAHDVERVVHEAEVLRLLDVAAVERTLDRARGKRGTQHVRAAIASPSPGPSRRELEYRFLALCRRHGIETPALNACLSTKLGSLEVDAYWPRHRLVVELDGAATHLTRRAFEEDRRRDAALIVQGYVPMRFTWARITGEASEVAAELLAATRSHLQPPA